MCGQRTKCFIGGVVLFVCLPTFRKWLKYHGYVILLKKNTSVSIGYLLLGNHILEGCRQCGLGHLGLLAGGPGLFLTFNYFEITF